MQAFYITPVSYSNFHEDDESERSRKLSDMLMASLSSFKQPERVQQEPSPVPRKSTVKRDPKLLAKVAQLESQIKEFESTAKKDIKEAEMHYMVER